MGPALLVIPFITVIESLKNVPELDSEVKWALLAMCRVRGRGMRLIGDRVPDGAELGEGGSKM